MLYLYTYFLLNTITCTNYKMSMYNNSDIATNKEITWTNRIRGKIKPCDPARRTKHGTSEQKIPSHRKSRKKTIRRFSLSCSSQSRTS